MLLKHPALTLVGGLGMAVGIAISAGFFAVLSGYIYPTLPLPEGERIVALENRDVALNDEERRSLHDFVAWREELRTVEQLAAFRTVSRTLVVNGGTPEDVHVAEMTAAGFDVARTPPLLGRRLLPEDEQPGAPAVVVIGHDVWQATFAGDPRVTGRTIRLGSVEHVVVGVMPQDFAFPENHRFWTPLRANPSAYARRAGPAIFIFGRLAPGTSRQQAQAELDVVGERAAAAYPETHARLRPMVMPYTHSLNDVQGISLWEVAQMQFMMTLLLVVVALNVAVLVYARTATRQGELAVRVALGASRGRIVGQLFAEALVLSLVAAAAGLWLAQLGVGFGNRILAMEHDAGPPFWLELGIGIRPVLFSVGLAILAAAIIGVLPALQVTGRRLQSDLRQLGATTGLRLGRTWTALIVGQVAVAVAALPAAVGMGWAQLEAAATTPTYAADEFVAAGIGLEDGAEVADGAGSALGRRLDELLLRLRAGPGVVAVTYQAPAPDAWRRVEVDGPPLPPGSESGVEVRPARVEPRFLEVFGARVVAGRGFVARDVGDVANPVIVNEAFVRQVLGGNTPLGRRIRAMPPRAATGEEATAARPWFEIVGVVQDLEENALNPDRIRPRVIFPAAAVDVEYAQLAVRLQPDARDGFAGRLREVAADVDPALRLGQVRSLSWEDRQERVAARLVGLAVALVLLSVFLLSAAGVYALMSFTVTQRRREIGIRSALGAQPRHVLHTVFARAGAQVAAGVVVGAVAALLLDTLSGGTLSGGRAAVIVPVLAVAMAVVALLAALGPARRGLRVEPTDALRSGA